MTNLKMFIPITKIDQAKRLVYGIATAEEVDSSGEICDYATTVPYYKAWSSRIEKASEGKSKGNLRSMHANIAAGKVTQIEFNDMAKQIEICAKVVDDDEWKKVSEGVYTGFSQGGDYVKKWTDGENKRYTANPSEISLVDNPCLPTATFEVIKADGGSELRKFQIVENNKMTKNETAGTSQADESKLEVTQGWQAGDGSFHISKAAAMLHNESLAKAAKEKANAKDKAKDEEDDDSNGDDEDESDNEDGPDGAAEKGKKADKAAESAGLEKRDFTDKEREKAADAGQAMPDGSFPIKTVQDLKNAIQAYGRAKDPAAAKAHIMERAKALGAEAELPDDWKGTTKNTAGELKKGMYEVGRLADIIASLNYLSNCSANEELREKDDKSIVPEQLKSQVAALTDTLEAMVQEESKEMTEGKDDSDSMIENGMFMAAKDKLGKVGAKMSAASKEQCKKMMKSASDHLDTMKECMKGMGMDAQDSDSDDDKGSEAKKMADTILTKKLEDTTTTLEKALSTIDTMNKRIEFLEKQPADAKGTKYNTLTKDGHEGESGQSNPAETAFNALMKRTDLSPEALQREMQMLMHPKKTQQ